MSIEAIQGIGGNRNLGEMSGASGLQGATGTQGVTSQGGTTQATSSAGINTKDQFTASDELMEEAGSAGASQQAAQAGAVNQSQATQGQGQEGGQEIKAALQTLASSKSDKVKSLAQQALSNGPDQASGSSGSSGSANAGKQALDQLSSLTEMDTKDLSEDEQQALGVIQGGKQTQSQESSSLNQQAQNSGAEMAAQGVKTS